METVVVSRHRGMVEFLIDRGIVDKNVPVIRLATAENVKDRRVVGYLPLGLSIHVAEIVMVRLSVPSWLRGAELDADQVALYAEELVTFKPAKLISRVSLKGERQ